VRRVHVFARYNRLSSSAAAALGGAIISLEGQVESDATTAIVKAAGVAATLWPFVFAGMLGTSIRAFSNWRVELGIELGVRCQPLLYSFR
jgi:phage tail tape-measure protein